MECNTQTGRSNAMAERLNFPDEDYEDALTVLKGFSDNNFGIGAVIKILTDCGNNMSGYVEWLCNFLCMFVCSLQRFVMN